jgi:topoisomerase IV subunit A
MSKEKNNSPAPDHSSDNIVTLGTLYQDFFLDYASYVILERAVPAIEDGLKPVQRRILHAMHSQHDGRYHKVANLIGQTMQYHPHGDAAIGDALVNLGQKDLLIDCQGNWGDIRTGDSAAAARYIEARLTKFAIDVAFNADTTVWQLSYDGRKREPVTLPMKFPMVLALGVDGIAVGLSTKILPHNFIELCKASIAALRGRKFDLYPDFQNGGTIDVENYNGGERGSKVRVRAVVKELDKKTLVITQLPYGVITGDLIDSILKANDKGQIKIKKVVDNTAAEVEILIELQPGVSPDITIDALYAFTNCEVSISPNCCVITAHKPIFTNVYEMLRISTENTKELLRMELEIKKKDLEERLHAASLEKIFIENRIYRDIEECETWEAVLSTIDTGLRKYVVTPSMKAKPDDKRIRLIREITEDDLTRLTEIKIKRISKYNKFKAEEEIVRLNEELKETQHHLDHLTDYAVSYFEQLLAKYSKGKERRTEITTFDTIKATEVVANNAKLYLDRVNGFVGYGLKKDEFVQDCSDIDDVVIVRKDGVMKIVRISEKVHVGKDVIHCAVFKKNDERTTYNLVYLDGKTGRSFVKRFQVGGITRDKEYHLTTGEKNSKVLYLTVNPNGESEIVTITLSPTCSARNKVYDYNFGDLEIKGRSSQGNKLTDYPVKQVKQKEQGKSTIGAQKIWYDDITGRLNVQERGRPLGQFDTGDLIIVLYHDGTYELTDYDLSQRFEPKEIKSFEKWHADMIVNAVHFDGIKAWTMVKRFKIETTKLREKFSYLTDHPKSKLLYASLDENPRVEYTIKVKGKAMKGEVELGNFMDPKGYKAVGNKLSDVMLTSIKEVKSEEKPVAKKTPTPPPPMAQQPNLFDAATDEPDPKDKGQKFSAGDTIEFD